MRRPTSEGSGAAQTGTRAPAATFAAALLLCGLALIQLARAPLDRAARSLRPPRPSPSAPSVRNLREGAPLDLNRASAGDLVLLPGVGPKLAQRIVDERARRSAFRSLDELLSVKGIGHKTLEKLRPLLQVHVAAPLQLHEP